MENVWPKNDGRCFCCGAPTEEDDEFCSEACKTEYEKYEDGPVYSDDSRFNIRGSGGFGWPGY